MTLFLSLRALLADGALCLAFFSRMPVPARWTAQRSFGTAIRMLPAAALLIGACGGLPLGVAVMVGLPHSMAAIMGIAAGLLATGGLHEDGLADTADGLGGGATRERKLAIMRDSRIGTYGVLAVVVILLWRVAALIALIDRLSGWRTALLILAAAAVSRPLALLPMAVLVPARSDGLGRGVGPLHRGPLAICCILATLVGIVVPLLSGTALGSALTACAGALLGACGVTQLARRHIGGYTGDIAGASQQVAEAGYLVGLLLLSTST